MTADEPAAARATAVYNSGLSAITPLLMTARPSRPPHGEIHDPLRGSAAQFERLVQGVADYAIYMLDPNGIIETWNSGAQRIKGYDPDEIIGSHYSRFYTAEDRDAGLPERNLATAAHVGRVEDEGWRIRRDGTPFWAHVIIDRIADADGTVLGFAKVTRDVTEQRRTANELEKAREQLAQSQKMEAIGQLTGGMAHDFNNLLMSVQSGLELLRARLPDDERTRSIFDTTLGGVTRGARLTQRLLAFARRQELSPTAVNLATLVHGLSDLVHPMLGSSITIASTLPFGLAPALVDANQLELALLNLVVNARDAMPEGGHIDITATAARHSDGNALGLPEGDYVALMVRDKGHGMSADALARAIEPFFTTKGVGKGTGLGLSMVHGLAEQSGGRLVLTSAEGQGTTATIWLPVARPASGHGPDPARGGMLPTAQGPQLRILFVDDDPLVRVTVAALLEDMGHWVVSSESGAQALASLDAKTPYDVLLTDYAMPGMTGTELIVHARQRVPHLAAVIATGYAETTIDPALGVVRLAKPFSRAALDAALRQVLGAPAP
ncbi:ATP-binding protein [Luteibacter sp.]|uniref:PAS domain-containing sensor histidine kinase n=1 Tax=Luteibacter sp. TaxID=1886636 RepID=UPI003F7E8653